MSELETLRELLGALPYELIGVVVVSIVIAVLVVLAAILVPIIAFAIWVRGWANLSNLMYRGYSIEAGNRPPLWKMRISGVALALSRRDFRKIPTVYREAEQLADDEVTFVQYAREVFDIDE